MDAEIERMAEEAPDDIRRYFEANKRYREDTPDDDDDDDVDENDEEEDLESEDDSELNIESEEEEPAPKKKKTAPKKNAKPTRSIGGTAPASPPRASGSGLQRRHRKEVIEPESEDEEAEEEVVQDEIDPHEYVFRFLDYSGLG